MRRIVLCVVLIALGAPWAPAQPAAPPAAQPGQGGPSEGMGDRLFFVVQTMRAIDEKTSLLIEQGRLDAAIEELRRVQSIDVPREHPVYELKARLTGRLATMYAAAGKKKEAVDTIKALLAEVLPGSPAEAAATFDAGVVYRKCDMPDEALKAFDRAIELSQKLAQNAPRLGPRPGVRRPPGGGRAPSPDFRQ